MNIIVYPWAKFNGSLVKLLLKLGHGWGTKSHRKLWDVIIYPCCFPTRQHVVHGLRSFTKHTHVTTQLQPQWTNLTNPTPVPYPAIRHSEKKYAKFFCGWCIVQYGISAFWDLWIRPIRGRVYTNRVSGAWISNHPCILCAVCSHIPMPQILTSCTQMSMYCTNG